MKQKRTLFVLLLLSLILCVTMTACGDQEEEDDFDGYVTSPPPTEEQNATVDQSAFINAAVNIFNSFAEDPEASLISLKMAEKNMKIENLTIKGHNLIGFEDPNIEKIYFTNNIVHTVYKQTPTIPTGYVPTDKYTVTNEYGSFAIQYDGFTYRYEFDPIFQVEPSDNDNDVEYPALTAEDMWYHPDYRIFMIDSEAIKDILRYHIEGNSESENESSIFDLEAMLDIFNDLYIECYFDLNEEQTSVNYFYMLGSYYSQEQNGLNSDIFSVKYNQKDANTILQLSFDYGTFLKLDVCLDKNPDTDEEESSEETPSDIVSSDTPANLTVSLVMGDAFNVADNITMDITAKVFFSEEPYVTMDGFLKDKAELSENLIKNADKIYRTYSGEYTLYSADRCETIYVWEDVIKAYLVFERTDADTFQYSRFYPYYNSQYACLATLDMELRMLTISSHTSEESLEDALASKYADFYQCEDGCTSICIYDTEFELYVFFEMDPISNKMKYVGYSKGSAYENFCEGEIDITEHIITVIEHCTLEETISRIKDTTFTIDGYDRGKSNGDGCIQVTAYDNASGYYLIFSITGGRAHYCGYSSASVMYGCVGTLYESYGSIVITEHLHSIE